MGCGRHLNIAIKLSLRPAMPLSAAEPHAYFPADTNIHKIYNLTSIIAKALNISVVLKIINTLTVIVAIVLGLVHRVVS